MPETEYKRGSPEEVNREYLRDKAAQRPGGTSMSFDKKDMDKSHLFVEEKFPDGFCLGVQRGRQAVQLLLTDKDNPETTVIAQISITEVVEYLKLRMGAQIMESDRLRKQAMDLLSKLETYEEKP